MCRAAVRCLLLTLLVGPAAALAQSRPIENAKPAVQQGALPVGVYQFQASAAPTEVQEGEPLTLTLRITATGPTFEEPLRPDLAQLAAGDLGTRKLGDLFFLEIPGAGEPKRPTAKVWEFTYLLRPKSTAVKKIPALKFSYLPTAGGQPRHRIERAIPLTVKPRTRVQLESTARILAPPGVLEIATGDEVLRREGPTWWFTPPGLALLVLGPPVVCLGWYLLWRRLYPDALQLRKRGHTRALRQAVRELQRSTDPGGTMTATVVTRYLRQRFDLAVTEPTPAEVVACLQQAGASSGMVQRAAGLLDACDGARFAPTGGRATLSADAIQFIQALEADLCAARPS